MIKDSDNNLIAANYPAVLARLMVHQGASLPSLFAGTSLSESTLDSPETLVPIQEYLTLIGNAKKLSAQADIGLRLGEALGVTTHGMTGLAAMSCKTFGEAIAIASRYFITRFPVMNFTSHRHEDSIIVTLQENIDLGKHKQFIVESILTSIQTVAKFLIGEHSKRIITEFTTSASPYPESYIKTFGSNCRFDREENRMICNAELLALPLNLFDPSTQKLAENNCNDALKKLKTKGGLRKQVRDIFRINKQAFSSIDKMAQQLNMSPRTISRKLKLENTCFQDILDKERRLRAINYLENTELSITQIAHELNFSDSAYFSRAFKKWTGRLPSHFRKMSNLSH